MTKTSASNHDVGTRSKFSTLQKKLIEKSSLETTDAGGETAERLSASETLNSVETELRLQTEALVEAREAAELQHQRYQQLFEFAPDGYFVTNLDGMIKMANRVASAKLNVEARYLAHKPLAIYIAPDQRSFFRKQLLRLRNGTVERWETNLQPRNLPGISVMISVMRSYSPLADADELLWQLQDLTEYQQHERVAREQYFRATFEQSPVGMAHVAADGTGLRVNTKWHALLGSSERDFHPVSIFDLADTEDRKTLRDLFSFLIAGKADTARQEIDYLNNSGAVINTLTNITAVRSMAGEFLYAIFVLEDITDRKRMEEAEHTHRLLAETLQDTALALTSTLDFSEVTSHILKNIGRIVPHDAASLLLLKDDVAYVERSRGYSPEGETQETTLQDFHIAIAESDRILQMMRTKNSVLIPHWEDHGSWDQAPGMAVMRSLVAAPILERDEVLGFLKLHSRTPNFFTEEHAKLLQAFAVQAAIAIQNAHAHEGAQALAAQNERHRLARDLHDAVTQTLFSASVVADSISRLWTEIPDQVQTQLQQLQLLTRGALGEMRTLLLELRPEYLMYIDLEAQLRQLLDAVQARKRIDVKFSTQVEIQTPPSVRIAFYRIAQEALNNIVKHSHASEILVLLRASANCVELTIKDNGVGFERCEKMTGFGLHTMHERAEEVGADLDVITHPNGGTSVRVVWGESKEG